MKIYKVFLACISLIIGITASADLEYTYFTSPAEELQFCPPLDTVTYYKVDGFTGRADALVYSKLFVNDQSGAKKTIIQPQYFPSGATSMLIDTLQPSKLQLGYYGFSRSDGMIQCHYIYRAMGNPQAPLIMVYTKN